MFCQVEVDGKTYIDGEAWAWGFWEGMQLRPDAWQVLEESEQADLLRPIYLLGAEEVEEELLLVDTPQKCHQLSIEVEANFPLIARFWQNQPSRAKPQQRSEPKQGRNDPCACGSGKKFKQCHGLAANDAGESE